MHNDDGNVDGVASEPNTDNSAYRDNIEKPEWIDRRVRTRSDWETPVRRVGDRSQ